MDNSSRIVSGHKLDFDSDHDKSLRPHSFDDFVGQSKIVENLKVFIKSAKIRKEPFYFF